MGRGIRKKYNSLMIDLIIIVLQKREVDHYREDIESEEHGHVVRVYLEFLDLFYISEFQAFPTPLTYFFSFFSTEEFATNSKYCTQVSTTRP